LITANCFALVNSELAYSCCDPVGISSQQTCLLANFFMLSAKELGSVQRRIFLVSSIAINLLLLQLLWCLLFMKNIKMRMDFFTWLTVMRNLWIT